MDLQSQSHAGIVRVQDIMLVFAEHQSHSPILDKHLGLVEGFQTLISEFSADVSLKSSKCVNFSEDLSCKKPSLFNKSLISNECDDYEAPEPCVLSDDSGNSLVDLPKESLVETFENVSDINVKNRLTSHAQFWCDTGASPWVMRVIDQGYSLPFIVEPPPAFFTNNQSALKHQAFVANEIQRLLETGCIREVERDEAHIISPLSAAENSEKLRLILDLRYLNSFPSVPKFKYEDI